ncbi:hypothetical protein CBW24_06885 [Pacificitalea manganoxidans]|uniref:DUF2254 domain-containing protein n=1 Tax=Pacificitalea manganoxidans TaxID=1411902 RepID=A0A291LYD3_9RHOB|nr:DUF2254 domain-containing protein [Pacificitalea manganoxidans]ATI41746.1 hypothetical protein CBW24_06885 [Pacificitalea manganoxidans]MDR6309210.1 putative membrane protein [Pacificitalea manganoxidans]
MISKQLWRLRRVLRKLWVRAAGIALLALVALAAAALLRPLIPDEAVERLGEDAVMPLLSILASSMLTVTTFSLTVMVSAHMQASSQITPRSHRLLLEDTTTQTVLATFLGAFVYALTAIILFRSHIYGATAAVVVFGFTVIVVALVILAVLRWIAHLSRLGSLDETLDQVEERVRDTLRRFRHAPTMGARRLADRDDLPAGLTPVACDRGGHVQFVDMAALARMAEDYSTKIYLPYGPGAFCAPGSPVAHIGRSDAALVKAVAEAFTFGPVRTFDQDARFGLTVLSEIASRALSPGLNDPGTAIEVTGRVERLLCEAQPETEPFEPPRGAERIHLHPTTEADLIEDYFHPVARDGAGMIEVALRLQRALNSLKAAAQRTDRPDMDRAARAAQDRLLEHAEAALPLASDREKLRALAKREA